MNSVVSVIRQGTESHSHLERLQVCIFILHNTRVSEDIYIRGHYLQFDHCGTKVCLHPFMPSYRSNRIARHLHALCTEHDTDTSKQM